MYSWSCYCKCIFVQSSSIAMLKNLFSKTKMPSDFEVLKWVVYVYVSGGNKDWQLFQDIFNYQHPQNGYQYYFLSIPLLAHAVKLNTSTCMHVWVSSPQKSREHFKMSINWHLRLTVFCLSARKKVLFRFDAFPKSFYNEEFRGLQIYILGPKTAQSIRFRLNFGCWVKFDNFSLALYCLKTLSGCC